MRTEETNKLFVTFKKKDGNMRIAVGTPVPGNSPKVLTLDEDSLTANPGHRYISIPVASILQVLKAEEFLRQDPAFRKVWLEHFGGNKGRAQV